MSGIVLSSSVRQNLLSLQSTADLLATTQNRLATGKKVNTALDNPTNFFTASALDARASDINNLLDGIGNGVQVLQAANTGITSLQKLVDSAKSVASQALQTTVGYSTKSNVSVSINGATADNILGTGAAIDATAAGIAETNNQTTVYSTTTGVGTAIAATDQTAYTNTAYTLGSALHIGTANAVATSSTVLNALTDGSSATPTGPQAGDTLTVNGKTITFNSGSGTSGSATAGTLNIDITSGTVQTLLTAIDAITGATGGNAATINGLGKIQLNTGVAANLTLANGTGTPLAELGLTATTATRGGGVTNTSAVTTGTTLLSGVQVPGGADGLTSGLTTADYLIVNNKTITFHAGNGSTGSIGANNLSIGLGDGTVSDILSAINTATGGTATIDGTGKINLQTSLTSDISLAGSAAGTLTKLGLSSQTSVTRTAAATPAITGATLLSGAASSSSNSLTTAFAAGDTVTVNGQNLTFKASGTAVGNNQINVDDTITTLLAKIDVLSGNTGVGSVASSVTGGVVTLHTGTTSDLNISSSNTAALTALGLGTGVSQVRGTGASQLNNLTLDIASTGGGTATHLTFGTGAGKVQSLNDLNNALSANNLQATLAQDGTLTITTSNDAASATIGTISGSSALSGQLFFGKAGSAPVADAAATASRNDLVNQYNNILNQITTTAQDASFNGVNLLGGDTLKLTFNETGKSTLSIHGVNFNAAGLGLANLNSGDFKDNESVNKVVSGLSTASSTLRAQASAFGSNLSIVQIRQDFSKNLINVLQTGSSNLTLADTNEEAANSQALSTRQSIAVSALALANQSQQSVLQLLR
jgi:flagellin